MNEQREGSKSPRSPRKEPQLLNAWEAAKTAYVTDKLQKKEKKVERKEARKSKYGAS